MTKILEAVFDGKVLRPVEPLNLKPGSKVKLKLEVTDSKTTSFTEIAETLGAEGPADWSQNIDKYLYGADHDNDD